MKKNIYRVILTSVVLWTYCDGSILVEMSPISENAKKIYSLENLDVNPNSHVFGIPIGALNVENIVLNFGKPGTVIQVNPDHYIYIYGKSLAIHFRKDKVERINIGIDIFHWDIGQYWENTNPVDRGWWTLFGEIKEGDSYAFIVDKLNLGNPDPNYKLTYQENNFSVFFRFLATRDQKGHNLFYSLEGVEITFFD